MKFTFSRKIIPYSRQIVPYSRLTGSRSQISFLFYPDSGISMDERIVPGSMIWSYNKAGL